MEHARGGNFKFAKQPDAPWGGGGRVASLASGGWVPRRVARFNLPGEAGVAMILAVDEVMDTARAAINVTGNALASAVIAKREGAVFGAPEEPAPEDA